MRKRLGGLTDGGPTAAGAGGAAGARGTAGGGVAGPLVQPGHPDRIARRHQLKAAVFGPREPRPSGQVAMAAAAGGAGTPGRGTLSPGTSGLRAPGLGGPVPGKNGPGRPGGPPGPGQPGAAHRRQPLLRVVTGQVLDASPQVLIIGTGHGEERLALTADARAWRGERTAPAAIRVGDHAVVRRHRSGREVADRIWANIGRVTGTIVQRHGRTLLVAQGSSHEAVVIGKQAASRIQVRFPRLEPGYLVDLIGIRHDGYLEGLVPATSQPTYRADHVPTPPLVNGHVPATISGAGMWHEPGDEPDGLTGAGYPAVDPQNATTAGPAGSGCVSLPYLSVGSLLRVRNDCTGLSRTLPVLGPADTARLFCDRSVSCGPSPRGRIVDLTVRSFVELGGELDEGNVNVTIEMGA